MSKLQRLRNELSANGIEALLVSDLYNVRYMTNFTGDDSVALISDDESFFITDSRYTEQAKHEAQGFKVIQHRGSIPVAVAELCKEIGIEKLGFEPKNITYATYQKYANAYDGKLVPVEGLIEKMRLVKTSEEIKRIQVACDIADAAFKHILDFIEPGKTELEVSNELEFFMRKSGATSSSFDIIVASGARSALPHGVATDKVIEKGDLVTLDYGAVYKGYVSDITRTIAVGEPEDSLKEIYQIVLDAQLKGVEQIRSGMSGKEADAICRNYIEAEGYGAQFGHSTGHGIGLEVHEGPALSFRSDTILEPGMVVTCEPGIYIEGVGGVRIEDDLLITEDGNKRLTHSPKDLIIL